MYKQEKKLKEDINEVRSAYQRFERDSDCKRA